VSGQSREARRAVVFVARRATGEALRSAAAVGRLEGVRLLGIFESAPQGDAAAVFADAACVEDVHDAGRLVSAARSLEERHGPLSGIVTAQETLLEPVALAREALGVKGMSAETVRRALDKPSLKRALARAGIMTARDSFVTRDEDARAFAARVGFPFVLKPLNGSGGLATWRVRDDEQLAHALDLLRPSADNAVLAEEYLRGEELCLDTITIADEPRFHSLCRYRPSILEALEDSSAQWTCVMPREIERGRYGDFIEQGLEAVRALSVGDAVTHMEGFVLEDGGVRFTDATLRPAGARIGPMLAFACDIDAHFAWARAAVDGRFDGPWERRYSVGTVFLRGPGGGVVESVRGLESVRREVGGLIVDARPPRVGERKSSTYTGEGYFTVRHRETRAVEDALRLIARAVRITYSDPEPNERESERAGAEWPHRLRHFDEQLNRPAWEDDHTAANPKYGEEQA
jgi:hypothetical protein